MPPPTHEPLTRALLPLTRLSLPHASPPLVPTCQGTFSTYISFFDDGHGDCAAPRAVGMELSWDALSSLPSVADAQVQPPASCNA